MGRGSRIEVPVRSENCTHLQCFDLASYLKVHDRNLLAVKRQGKNLVGVDATVDEKHVSWNCPICKEKAEVRDLHIDGYFDSLLQEYKDLLKVEEVKLMSDGSHRPIVKPKVEVFPVSDSPVIQTDHEEAEEPVDIKPLNADEEEVSADAMEITDLSLEQVRRLPETHQLCKAVKRRLLNKFKHMEKNKPVMEKPHNAASTTTTLGSSGADADDAPLSRVDAGEHAQKSQAEAEQLRRAIADAEHDKLLLRPQDEHLHSDVFARYMQMFHASLRQRP
ncbi:hypothetical protein AAVH_20439 [Aphelenchoides avenae]|nr:hypothetical protein AAVH_20439 [Aphelenchus avenae]